VILNTASVVDHDCVVGDHVHLSPGARLGGGVTVGRGSHIGMGAIVIQGLRIGAGALVAAGAVVLRDVGDGDRVAGVPARKMSP
jgi:UDP-perosamine 4-acetyltransferase